MPAATVCLVKQAVLFNGSGATARMEVIYQPLAAPTNYQAVFQDVPAGTLVRVAMWDVLEAGDGLLTYGSVAGVKFYVSGALLTL